MSMEFNLHFNLDFDNWVVAIMGFLGTCAAIWGAIFATKSYQLAHKQQQPKVHLGSSTIPGNGYVETHVIVLNQSSDDIRIEMIETQDGVTVRPMASPPPTPVSKPPTETKIRVGQTAYAHMKWSYRLDIGANKEDILETTLKPVTAGYNIVISRSPKKS